MQATERLNKCGGHASQPLLRYCRAVRQLKSIGKAFRERVMQRATKQITCYHPRLPLSSTHGTTVELSPVKHTSCTAHGRRYRHLTARKWWPVFTADPDLGRRRRSQVEEGANPRPEATAGRAAPEALCILQQQDPVQVHAAPSILSCRI